MKRIGTGIRILSLIAILAASATAIALAHRGNQATQDTKAIEDQMMGLRNLSDDVRGGVTKKLAMQIRALPAGKTKVLMANGLANLATEGDFGKDTLQEVATTLAFALKESPAPQTNGQPDFAYMELAQLVRYEHVQVSMDAPDYLAAVAAMDEVDKARSQADFTLYDLAGKSWTLSELRGKVVLVNFWATWCPPCRKEMPDMVALYNQFKSKGFVILAISDEVATTVQPFISGHGIDYTILLDPGRKINALYHVDGIPKSFIYDREGKLVAQAMDMRTKKQFLELLGRAGLK